MEAHPHPVGADGHMTMTQIICAIRSSVSPAGQASLTTLPLAQQAVALAVAPPPSLAQAVMVVCHPVVLAVAAGSVPAHDHASQTMTLTVAVLKQITLVVAAVVAAVVILQVAMAVRAAELAATIIPTIVAHVALLPVVQVVIWM
ncbi:MAG: hypothetical protein GY696_26155 [Gammaproteobacteria bacterium]|nr:hypothetical protein [Gammaproteobacteria bacterium]